MRAAAALTGAVLLMAGCSLAGQPAQKATATASPTAMRIQAEAPAAFANVPPPDMYTAVAAVGHAVWVAGPGFVAGSSDGGATWQRHGIEGIGSSEITFADSQHGWLIGTAIDSCTSGNACTYLMYATDDGGRTWSLRFQTKAFQPQAVQFVSAEVGYGEVLPVAACHRRAGCLELLRTTDGGATWTPIASPVTPAGPGLHFTDAAHGWLVGTRCDTCTIGIFATSDGGSSWSETLATDVPAGQGGGSLAFSDSQHGWALIGNTGMCTMGGCWGALYATTDGGARWSRLQADNEWRMSAINAPPGFPGQPVFVDATSGWIPIMAGAGPGIGGVAHTSDGGRTWTRVGANRLWDIRAVAAASGQVVWAVGSRRDAAPTDTFAIRSTDGGRTWSQVLPLLAPTAAMDFTDASTGYGLGDAADPRALLATSDGGRTWRPIARLPFAPSLVTIVGTTGYVADAAEDVAKTTDGQGWHVLPGRWSDGGALLYLRFFDPTHGLRITAAPPSAAQVPAVQTTTDGGASWSAPHDIAGASGYISASFSDLAHGLLIARSSMLRTTDGGASWTDIGALLVNGPQPLFALTPSQAWMSDDTRLLATSDGGAVWRARSLSGRGALALDFVSESVGWMLDDVQNLWHTTNGGVSWQRLN